MIKDGYTISIGKAKVEGAVVQTIRDWAIAHPDELVALQQKVRWLRATACDERGFTNDRLMLHKAEIPVTLYNRMTAKFGKLWEYDPWLKNLFFDHFKVGLVNRTSRLKM